MQKAKHRTQSVRIKGMRYINPFHDRFARQDASLLRQTLYKLEVTSFRVTRASERPR
jgi:hypothetical protein